MRLKIRHFTRYNYPKKIFLEPHYLHFKPLTRPYYHLEDFVLKVHPHYSGISERIGLEDNHIFQAWFNELTDHLEIDVSIVVTIDSEAYKPLGFIMDPHQILGNQNFSYSDDTRDYIKPFLACNESDDLSAFFSQIIKENDGEVIPCLSGLVEKIYKLWEHKIVEDENMPEPISCFSDRKGSCRDLAWMMIAMLRMAGLASRYVSGYAYNEELETGHELHAWVETYLPGAGWVGLDPSSGLFTHYLYIPVATSYHPSNTMPVIGNYRGNVKSKMETSVSIEQV